MNNIDTLCISGGGLKGFSFLSALNVLVEHNYLDLNLINKYVGTSFGAIFGFLLNIGYSTEELVTYLNNYDKKKLSFDLDLELFFTNNGFCDGTKILDFIEVLLNLKIRIKDINFKDLEILTKKKLLIITTNFSKGKKEVFSSDTTPLVSVIKAIRMSISIPLLMTPVKYNDDYYVDGGLTSNLGVEFCDPLKTLCICLQNPKKFDYSDLSNIISGLITITINNKDTSNFKKLEIIQPSCCNLINSDDDIFKSLIDIGIKSGLKFLRKEYINKIQLIQFEINLLSTKNQNEIVNINHEIVNINQEIINIDKEIEITDFQIENICYHNNQEINNVLDEKINYDNQDNNEDNNEDNDNQDNNEEINEDNNEDNNEEINEDNNNDEINEDNNNEEINEDNNNEEINELLIDLINRII
jgi:predicted acylesterase/phospholipase RssA